MSTYGKGLSNSNIGVTKEKRYTPVSMDFFQKDKLSSTTNAENAKHSKFDFLSQRIGDIDARMNEVSEQSNKKFNIVKESVTLL